ncbi:MAG: Na(+)/H(+) antiporter subunit B [Salinivirgaceae bacterium]|nr:MAG: Na(+)/H(+) antiporter subunit B [Salinivirgaceae bacterium]
MNLNILQYAEKPIRWLLIIISIVALLRGHNYPGGGFIGGLLAGLAIVFQSLAYDVETVRKKMKLSPQSFIGIGLAIAAISLLPSIIGGAELMQAYWVKLQITESYVLKLGTPLIFDIGIFFSVIGIVLMFIFNLSK